MVISILLTCHNRKNKTLRCLRSLKKQINPNEDDSYFIYLVDDGSTDGTTPAIYQEFPDVNIIQGAGNLYWYGGMQLAWEHALKKKSDFFFWLNDDVILYKDALFTMIETYNSAKKKYGSAPVIGGNLCDPITKKISYGGYTLEKGYSCFRTHKIDPTGDISQCDTINGNVVLIPKSVVNIVGTLDKKFTHAMGDFDYGLRCRDKGIPIATTAGFIGECSNNPPENAWFSPNMPLLHRISKLNSPTGLPPREYYYYIRKHTGILTGLVMQIKLYLRLFFPSLWR